MSHGSIFVMTAQELTINITYESNKWFTTFNFDQNRFMIFWYLTIIISHGSALIFNIYVIYKHVGDKGYTINLAAIILVSNLIGNILRFAFVIIDPLNIRQIVSLSANSILGTFSVPWGFNGYLLIGLYWHIIAERKLNQTKIMNTQVKVITAIIITVNSCLGLAFGIIRALYIRPKGYTSFSFIYFVMFIIMMGLSMMFYVYASYLLTLKMGKKDPLRKRIIKSTKLNAITLALLLICFAVFIDPVIGGTPSLNLIFAALIAVTLALNSAAQVYHFNTTTESSSATTRSKSKTKSKLGGSKSRYKSGSKEQSRNQSKQLSSKSSSGYSDSENASS